MTKIVCSVCGYSEEKRYKPGHPVSQEQCPKCYNQGSLEAKYPPIQDFKWVCPHCKTWNALKDKTCYRCGCPRYQPKEEIITDDNIQDNKVLQ